MLQNLTIAANFVGLVVSLWLGVYLVTRSPRRPEARLLALALLSLGGFFLNELLALGPPRVPSAAALRWLRPLVVFWPRNVFAMGWTGWLQGWLPAFGIMFWHHATLHLLPGPFTRGRRLEALTGYGLALASVVITIRFPAAWQRPAIGGDPLFSNALRAGPLFPLLPMGFMTFAGLSALNLAEAARSAPAPLPARAYRLLLGATVLAAATGILALAGGWLHVGIPQALTALLLAGAMLLAGIAVGRYHALLERRPPQRDFSYIAAEAALVLMVYVGFVGVLTRMYPLPALTMVWFGCLAAITHALVDAVRLWLDRRPGPALDQRPASAEVNAPTEPTGGTPEADSSAPAAATLEAAAEPAAASAEAGIPARVVEQALRNLHDYAYLADSPLVQLRLVQQRLGSTDGGTRTHIEHCKAVSAVVSEAVGQLRPGPADPPAPLPRDWYPYVILRQAYMECEPNAEIMARLYISEGTFNRTRRTAIRSVARLLGEMEAALGRTAE